jgi:uncharacterized protein YbcI
MEESSALTLEQLEQKLAQEVIVLYQTHLGHQLQRVSCKLRDKTLTIVAEDSMTRLEQFLVQNNKHELAREVRANLNKVLEPDLKFLIEEVLDVPVIDVLCNSELESSRTSVIAVLSANPSLVCS